MFCAAFYKKLQEFVYLLNNVVQQMYMARFARQEMSNICVFRGLCWRAKRA
jgi:hypothetical protein